MPELGKPARQQREQALGGETADEDRPRQPAGDQGAEPGESRSPRRLTRRARRWDEAQVFLTAQQC